tara:strand:+ start:2662 stop:3213 length:552 start_codon:yes stop_codon:yes gene_type:complete
MRKKAKERVNMDTYEIIEQACANKYGKNRASDKNRKSLGDFWLDDTHAVDVKSSDVSKENFSPNLVSASKAEKWLSDGKQLSYIFVKYQIANDEVEIISETDLIPINHISWDCLSIQAQGKGVIQLRDNRLKIEVQTVDEWLQGLARAYLTYINKEMEKLCKLESKYASLCDKNSAKKIKVLA